MTDMFPGHGFLSDMEPEGEMNLESVALARPTLSVTERSASYLRHLLFFIFVATLFEGYDVLIINLALPYLGRDFAAEAQTLGLAVGLISVGTIAAFAPVRLADRYGRRPVFLWASAGYTVFTVLTAFSVSLYDFVFYQFIARLFMVTEVGVGSIILTEELPARYRGAGIALMFSAGLIGGIVGSALFPLLVGTALGWRLLYLAGGGLFVLLLWYWRRVEETRRWRQEQEAGVLPRQSLLASFGELRLVFARAYRPKLLAGASVWFTTNFWSAACLFFFSYYVINERGWSAAQVGYTLTLGYLLALVGYAAVGPLLDLVGRRFTACLYFTLGGVSAVVCFVAESPLVITSAYSIVLGMNAVWAISATITSELFPTHLRGTANAVVNNLLGRTGMVLAPALVGVLSTWVGSVGTAVAMMASLNFLCVPVILWLLTETKGKQLEEIR
jgi:putative MFS transporter